MCGGQQERTELEGGGRVCSIMRLGVGDDVIYRSTKRNRDWAVCGEARLKTSTENNSYLLRCFIEPKYLKKRLTYDENNAICTWHFFHPETHIFFHIYRNKHDHKVLFINNVRLKFILQSVIRQWFYRNQKPDRYDILILKFIQALSFSVLMPLGLQI